MILIIKCSFLWKQEFMALFHGWGSTASSSRLELLGGGSILCSIKFSEVAGCYSFFINLWRTNNANAEIWSKERSIGPYVATMLFPQVLGFSKIPISHLFYELGKLGNINSTRPTFQSQNVESMGKLGKLMS